ncbi:carboxypeptidase regulatory-like domain-containing protein [Candidatus Woesearchaeota archaeon]|nr:carboxypeptidase regulatory-like domain-containing protein [Candidatus Woesearchaeota archaeon]
MNFKYIIILIVVSVLASISVSSARYVEYRFYTYDYDLGQDVPVTDVEVRGFTCNDSDCNTVSTDYWSLSTNTGSSDRLTVTYPTNLPSSGYYAIYFFKEGFIGKKYRANYWGTLSSDPVHLGRRFNIKEGCSAPISLQISNKIGEWLPLTISTDTELDGETASALTPTSTPPGYFPSEFDSYFDIETHVLLEIIDDSTEEVVKSVPQIIQVFGGGSTPAESEPYSFSWPSSESYPGNFTVKVTSHITDPLCVAVVDEYAEQPIEVLPELTDTCYNFVRNVDAQPVSAPNIRQNEEAEVSFEKISYLADFGYDQDYNLIYDLQALPSIATVRLMQDTTVVQTDTFPIAANTDPTQYEDYAQLWTPQNEGQYTLNVEITADDQSSVCPTNTPASQTVSVTVNPPPLYDLTITVTAAGSPLSGANVALNKTGIQWSQQTNQNGQATYNGPPGTYTMTISRSGYQTYKETYTLSSNYEMTRALSQGSSEICDNTDNDFDSTIDEGCDKDKDGYSDITIACSGQFRDGNNVLRSCTQYWNDCDDNNPSVNPGVATEVCNNNIDDNCNGLIDCAETWCQVNNWWETLLAGNPCTALQGLDVDGDGYANGTCTGFFQSDGIIKACADFSGDCDDSKSSVHPGAEEICDSLDNNCDENSRVDEGCDSDSDGYADEDMTCAGSFLIGDKSATRLCSEYGDDCDDENVAINPGAQDICYDGIDNNCNPDDDDVGCAGCRPGETKQCGQTDTGACQYGTQTCGSDGTWGQCSGAVNPTAEICDGLDNDCDGQTDEAEQCCPTNGETRMCAVGQCQSTQTCTNNAWQPWPCDAECPANAEITLRSPVANRRYPTCDDDTGITVDYSFYEGIKCSYKLNGMKSFVDIASGRSIRAPLGTNSFTLKCNEKTQTIGFIVYQTEGCNIIDIGDDDDTGDIFIEEGYTEEDIDAAEETAKDLGQEVEYSYLGDETIIKTILTPNKNLGNLTYSLFIPKCLTEYLEDLEIDYENYEVIKEDPLIAWHFTDVNERIELTYKIKRRIDPDCLEQIKGLPIADLIGDQLESTEGNLNKVLIIGGLMAVITTFVIYFQRFHPDVVKYSESQYEQQGIMKAWEMHRQKMKEMGFKSNEQKDTYMKQLGLSEEERKWQLGRK